MLRLKPLLLQDFSRGGVKIEVEKLSLRLSPCVWEIYYQAGVKLKAIFIIIIPLFLSFA